LRLKFMLIIWRLRCLPGTFDRPCLPFGFFMKYLSTNTQIKQVSKATNRFGVLTGESQFQIRRAKQSSRRRWFVLTALTWRICMPNRATALGCVHFVGGVDVRVRV
jgi:hypothetical protein